MSSCGVVNEQIIADTARKLLLSDYFARSYNYRRITRNDSTIIEKIEVTGNPSSSPESGIFLVAFIVALCISFITILIIAICAAIKQSIRSSIIHHSRRQQNSLSPKDTPHIMDRSKEKHSLPDGGKTTQMPSPAEEPQLYRFPSEFGDVVVTLFPRRVSKDENASDPTIRFDDDILIELPFMEQPLAIKINQPNPGESNLARIPEDVVEIICSSEDDVGEKQNLSEESQALKTPTSVDTSIDDHVIEEDGQTSLQDDICETQNSLKESQALKTPPSNDTPTEDHEMEKDVQTNSQDDTCETQNSSMKSQPLEAPLRNDDNLVTEGAAEEKEES